MKRENFGSRLGFLLVSAGCAIGIGNVWKFPYVTGENGGGVFVLFYLLFLIIMGVPVLTMSWPWDGPAGKAQCWATPRWSHLAANGIFTAGFAWLAAIC